MNTAATLDKTRIAALIPHSGAMCLLDCVVQWDAAQIECLASSHRGADNPLRRDGVLPISAGIEYAAQAMAIHGGLLAPPGNPPRRGYLAVLSDVRWSVAALDECAAPLRIVARRVTAIAGGTSYDFEVFDGALQILGGQAVIAFEPAT